MSSGAGVTEPVSMERERRHGAAFRFAAAILISAAAVCVTANAWDNPFVLDDRTKVVSNPDIATMEDFPSRLVYPYEEGHRLERNDPSRPLVFAIWTLVRHFHGLNPVPYRIVNALFHALTALLLFLLLLQVFRRAGLASARAGSAHAAAAIAALLFALLPIHVGTASYVYALSDVLGSALVLASIVLFLARANRWHVAGSVTCFCLALLTKQSTLVLPALLVAFEWLLPTAAPLRSRLRAVLPHVALAALYLAARLAYFGALGDLEGQGQREPLLAYASNQPLVVLRYLWLTFVPRGLALDHHLPPGTYSALLRAAGFVAVVGIGAGALVLARRRAARPRLLALGVVFAAIALAPTSSFLPTVDPMVERRAYLANVGTLLAAAVGLELLFGRLRRRRSLAAGCLACALGLGAYAAESVHRNEVFHTRAGVWREALAVHPDSPRALNNLGSALLDRGEFRSARDQFERLVASNPHPIPLANLARLHEIPSSPFHDDEAALSYYERSIAAGARLDWVYEGAARLLTRGQAHARAEQVLRLGVERVPRSALLHNELGLCYVRRRAYDEAEAQFRLALSCDPDLVAPLRNLAKLARDRLGS